MNTRLLHRRRARKQNPRPMRVPSTEVPSNTILPPPRLLRRAGDDVDVGEGVRVSSRIYG